MGKNQVILNCQNCKDALKDMQNKSGRFWFKRQVKLFLAVRNKKGRFAELSDKARLNMMENIEINVLGHSRFTEQRKQEFLAWFRNTFGRNYNEIKTSNQRETY